mmetsp:Transcript_25595/g.45388  ORF Transcript_25595/g.45388 Transcript_25595/m.45388 type:complete len:146 (-) Transcript_25595:28-465(-)
MEGGTAASSGDGSGNARSLRLPHPPATAHLPCRRRSGPALRQGASQRQGKGQEPEKEGAPRPPQRRDRRSRPSSSHTAGKGGPALTNQKAFELLEPGRKPKLELRRDRRSSRRRRSAPSAPCGDETWSHGKKKAVTGEAEAGPEP